jgi:hypothetical protein
MNQEDAEEGVTQSRVPIVRGQTTGSQFDHKHTEAHEDFMRVKSSGYMVTAAELIY